MTSAVSEMGESFLLIKEGVIDYGIILLNPEGRITSWNAGAERLFGYTEAEALGQAASVIFMAEDIISKQPEVEMQTAIANGRSDDERLHRRKDGSCFMASGVLTALQGQNGQLRGFVKVVRDITDRLRTDRLREKADQYETLAVLAGGLAHDFNNLLTSILGNTSFVLEQIPPFSPIRAPLEAAADSSRRAADLTRRLLAYAGKGQFVSRRLNISQLIYKLQSQLHNASKGVRLEFSLVDDLPDVKGDPTQIEQVIMDLIINAAEAMANLPGSIQVSTALVTLTRAELDGLGFDQANPGSFVFCEIADRGAGMEEATRAKMFEPFFTTKFLGRGLGLPAVSGIVRKHKGAIRVGSEIGVGTSVTIFLPAEPREGN